MTYSERLRWLKRKKRHYTKLLQTTTEPEECERLQAAVTWYQQCIDEEVSRCALQST